MNYTDKKFSKLLNCTTDEETFEVFQKIWKREHGGLYNLTESFTPPENLPFSKNGKIVVTDTASNSKVFQNKYIKTLNELLLKNDTGIINLDFCNNYGGKPEVMIGGLLPIFNNFEVSVLSYYYDKDDKRHYDVLREGNNIICISNDRAEVTGTKKKMQSVKEINIWFNIYSASSAEQSIICLMALDNHVKLNINGEKSAGFTTVNKYMPLSKKYGIEIPIGHMGTKTKVFYNGL